MNTTLQLGNNGANNPCYVDDVRFELRIPSAVD